MIADDAIVTGRDTKLRDYHVVITAERIERAEVWLVIGRVDGALHDAEHSDFPEETAEEMLAEIGAEFN